MAEQGDGYLKQGAHADPLDPSQPRPDPLTWPTKQRRAFRSPLMDLYRASLLLESADDIRSSVLDDLSTYFGLSPEECARACINWEQWSVQEWHSAPRNTPEDITNFYHTTQSWAFDLMWYAYLQAEGYMYPVGVVVAQHLPEARHKGRHLDFGSGVGTTSQFFRRLGYESDLADISTSLLSFARYRLERRSELATYIDLNVASLEPHRYDVITAIDTLVHVPDLRQTAEELHQALKPNGILVTNFDIRPPTPENAWHLYADDLPLRWQLQRAGFEPMISLDRRATLYQRVETAGLAYGLRGVRDAALLHSAWRPTYRTAKYRVRKLLKDTISRS